MVEGGGSEIIACTYIPEVMIDACFDPIVDEKVPLAIEHGE